MVDFIFSIAGAVGILIGTLIVAAIVFTIASKIVKTAALPAGIAGIAALLLNISLIIESDDDMRTSAIISTVVVALALVVGFIVIKDELKKDAKKQNQTITEDDLKNDE